MEIWTVLQKDDDQGANPWNKSYKSLLAATDAIQHERESYWDLQGEGPTPTRIVFETESWIEGRFYANDEAYGASWVVQKTKLQ